jgi:hypothetical protein
MGKPPATQRVRQRFLSHTSTCRCGQPKNPVPDKTNYHALGSGRHRYSATPSIFRGLYHLRADIAGPFVSTTPQPEEISTATVGGRLHCAVSTALNLRALYSHHRFISGTDLSTAPLSEEISTIFHNWPESCAVSTTRIVRALYLPLGNEDPRSPCNRPANGRGIYPELRDRQSRPSFNHSQRRSLPSFKYAPTIFVLQPPRILQVILSRDAMAYYCDKFQSPYNLQGNLSDVP